MNTTNQKISYSFVSPAEELDYINEVRKIIDDTTDPKTSVYRGDTFYKHYTDKEVKVVRVNQSKQLACLYRCSQIVFDSKLFKGMVLTEQETVKNGIVLNPTKNGNYKFPGGKCKFDQPGNELETLYREIYEELRLKFPTDYIMQDVPIKTTIYPFNSLSFPTMPSLVMEFIRYYGIINAEATRKEYYEKSKGRVIVFRWVDKDLVKNY